MAVGIINLFVYISCYIGAFGITLQPTPTASCQRYNSLILTCSISEDWSFVAFHLETGVGIENIAAFTDDGGSCKDNAIPTPGLYQTSCNYNTKTFYLTINNVTDTYNGRFIECISLPGNVKVQTTINVQYVPTSFPSITQLPNRPIIEGSKLTLTCKISGGNPLATIVWQCTGFSTVASTGTPPTDEVVSSVEHVVTKADNGKECVCTGKHLLWIIDKLERHTLDVYYQPASFPLIIQTPQGPVNNGDSIVLTCSIQGGNPLAVLTWQCEGYVPVTPTGSPSATTTVSNVQLTVNINHNGAVCTCIGTHPAWNQSKRTDVILDVRYAPASSPQITQIPTGPINEGVTVNLTCTISIGNPLATIVWQCSGFDIITPTVTPPTDESVSMITRVVTKDDNGKECVCIGKHLLWDDDKETRQILDINFKPFLDSKKPYSPGHVTAAINSTIRLTLTVNASPVPTIEWTFRADENWNSCNFTTVVFNTTSNEFFTTSSVLINNVNSNNFGDYVFTARNTAGVFSRRFVAMEEALLRQEMFASTKENTGMFLAGIVTLVVGLLSLMASVLIIVRNSLKNKTRNSSKTKDYSDIQRSNPAFTDPYTTLQSEIETKASQDKSVNTYEECGRYPEAHAYSSVDNMESEPSQHQQHIYVY